MPEMMVPKYAKREELIQILADALNRVCQDDSFEGSISWEFPWDERTGDPVTDPEGPGFRVRAAYRVGNSMGQGGMRMYGEMREMPSA